MDNTNANDGGERVTLPAVKDAPIPGDASKGSNKPSKPRSRRKPKPRKSAAAKASKDATYIVGHDGNRVTTDKYFADDSAEDTFIIGHDGKRVKSANYKDGS